MTHVFHPLFEREFELVQRQHTWGGDRVYFHDDSGRLTSLPARWTSVVAPDPFVVVSAGRAMFRVSDLLAMTELCAQLSLSLGSLETSTAQGGVK